LFFAYQDNSMKFAFSTIACPTWDFETIAARAKEYGYDGVEVRGFLNESILTAANVFLTGAGKVRGIFESQGIAIACLGSSIAMTGHKRRDAQLAADLRTYIDAAKAIGTSVVRISDTEVRIGQDRSSAAVALAKWLLPIGDYAADHGVSILVENMLSFRTAKEMWGMLEIVNHPAIACCWDLFNASLSGESPWVSVPTLNSRIEYAHVKDAKFSSLGATFCKLGEGEVPVQKFLTRLRGIGYSGWVTFEWEKAWLPAIAEPEEVLPDAIRKLREWTRSQHEPETQAEAVAAH
jgi:sugar phosphate isomerase/epimerase